MSTFDFQKVVDYSPLVEAIREGIGIVDTQERIIYCNSSFASIFELTQEELTGKSLFDFLDDLQRQEIIKQTTMRMKNVKSVYELTIRLENNKKKVISVSVSPVIDSDGFYQGAIGAVFDITERKQAEEALRTTNEELEATLEELRATEEELKQQFEKLQEKEETLQESERRFRAMLENVQLIAVTLDKQCKIVFCNDFLLELTGWQRDEVIGQNYFEIFVSPEDRERINQTVLDFMNLKTVKVHGENNILTWQGEKRLISWSNMLLYDLQGNVIGSASIGEDITERKLAEEKLRSAHQQLMDIIEFLPDATLVVDQNKKVIAWNRAIEEMTGVPKKDILGKGNDVYSLPFYGKPRPILIDLIFSDDREVEKQNSDEYRFIERKGNTIYGENFVPSLFNEKGAFLWGTASPLFDSSGNLLGAIESIRDITRLKKVEEAFRDSEDRYRTIFETTGTATIIVEEDTTIALANAGFEKLSGYSKEEIEGLKSWIDFFAKDQLEKMIDYHHLRRINPNIAPRNYESHFIDRQGNVKNIFITVAMIPGTSKSVASYMDITELKRAEEVLKRYQLLSEHARDIILFICPDGHIMEVNDAAVAAYGYDRKELLSMRVHDLRDSVDEPLIATQMEQALSKGLLFETIHRRKDGTTFPVEVSSQGAIIGSERVLLSVVRDVTVRKRVEEQLQHLATHDSLTNIPNRYSLEETLKRVVAKARRGEKSALLLIDLDNFKMVNDTLGHAAGDELLITLANILKSNLRDGDLLARLGGDEFVVLLEGATAEEAGIVAEKLRRVVEERELCLIMHESCFDLSISIGLVMVDGTLNFQKLLSLADTALYAAKEDGRNRVVFVRPDEDTTAKLSETNKLVSLIKNALKENRFSLFFQPVVDVSDGKISHHEALIRLLDPSGKIILPGRFISVAERFGLMPQIDHWVVRSSLSALREHPDLKLFVNLSGVSLGDEALLELIENNIRESGIDPSRIGFEITETAAVKDTLRAERWIHRLKGIGCRFALDDFGIGFSSFTYLRVLPVDYLKIDGSYIRNLDTDQTHFALVQAMNTVAHTLGKKTVAEFVENENILKILHELKIDCGQGYYLGEPAPMV